MGYDYLEDNDMAALDGSRTGGNFANDIAIRTKRVIAGTQKQPVNVSAIIKNIALKYSKKIETCEEADEVISKIESEIVDTLELVKDCKAKKPFNKKRMLKLKAQYLALKEQLEFTKQEKVRLECKEDIKNGEQYANITDVTITENENQENTQKPESVVIKVNQKKDIDPIMLGVGILAIAVIGYSIYRFRVSK